MTHSIFRNGSGDRYCSRCDRSWDADEEVGEPCVPVQAEIWPDKAVEDFSQAPHFGGTPGVGIGAPAHSPVVIPNWYTGDVVKAGDVPAILQSTGSVMPRAQYDLLKSALEYAGDGSANITITNHSINTKSKPRLIAFAGKKGSGKDTAAQVLIDRGFTRVAMAGAIKDMLRAVLLYRGYDIRLVERHIEGDMKEVPCAAFNGKSARFAMQTVATEWGREMIDPNLWVDAVKDRTAYLLNKGESVVITDIRFPNEIEMVRKLGGSVHLIERPGLASTDTHVSENLLDDAKFDTIFSNEDTIETLHALIASTLSL